MIRAAAVALIIVLPALAQGQTHPDLSLDSGRYRARYPGLIVGATVLQDPRDQSFSASGARQSGVVPSYGAGNEFPLTRFQLGFDWQFPAFEAAKLPFVSSRLWQARAALGYAETSTKGPLRDRQAAAGDPPAKAGISDIELAIGPFLVGSGDWRTRSATPFSAVLLAELRLPIGAHDPSAPNNAGDSVFAYGARLGVHWQPSLALLNGFRLDAGVRGRWYGADQEPAFNAQAPTQAGRDLSFDATLARKLWRSVHAQVSYTWRDGAANEYRNVRATANPPDAPLLNDTFPDPAAVRDGGTREQRLQVGLGVFVTQRLWLGAAWSHPLSGRSGSATVPYLAQLQNCEALNACNPRSNGSDGIDGLGSARTFASDSFQLQLRWQPRSSQGGP